MSAILQSGKGDVFGPDGGVTDGDLVVYSGTSGKILGSLPRADALPVGGVVQTVVQEFNSWLGSSAIIPPDNTIPQIGEGLEMFTMPFTPKYATSRICLTFQGTWFTTTALYGICALFRNSVATALATDMTIGAVNGYSKWMLMHYDPAPGSLAAITYRIRFGPHATGSIFVNGNNTTQNFAGTQKCVLTAQEIRQ